MNTLLKKLPATSLLFIWVIPTLIICGSAWMTKTVSTRSACPTLRYKSSH